MNCLDAEKFLDAYLDGELSGAMRVEFDAHRLRCTRCQQLLTMLESCQHIITADIDTPKLSGDFTNDVMDRVRGVQRPAPRRNLRLWTALLTAPGLAAAVLLAVWLRPVPAPEPAPTLDIEPVMEIWPIDQNQPPILQNYVQGVLAAGQLPSDVSRLTQYAMNMPAPGDVVRAADNPFQGILRAIFPAAEATDEAPEESDAYSL